MNLFKLFKRRSYCTEFNDYHRERKSFSWELANLEGRLLTTKDPEKLADLQKKIEKVKFYIETTRKMVTATKYHDKKKYDKAARLYKEVLETDIYYTDLAKKYLNKCA